MNNLYCDVSNILLNGSTDKNTTHKYGVSYDLIFNSQYLKLGRPLRVLEIGVSLFGEGSVGPLSEIPFVEKYIGLDNKTYSGEIPNEKVTLYTGPEYDAYTPEMIDFLKKNEEKFDIIIDDGPHTWESQEWFFINYYSLLNDGGVLLCEDIFEGNYNSLQELQKRLDLYVLDLRVNSNNNRDEIIALRFKPENIGKKNALVIPVYNSLLNNKEYRACVNTWEFYCNKYNIELNLLEGEKQFNEHPDHAAMCYDRWLERQFPPSKYNRVTFVDADTIVRWDAFDFNEVFDQNNIGIAVIADQGGPNVFRYHFDQWLNFRPNLYSFVKEYFNAGFVSMKSSHLYELQKTFPAYKEYYYTEKDEECHVRGVGKKGGVRIDGMDQTAINVALQELFSKETNFVPKTFNLQLSYFYGSWDDFFSNCKEFGFINEAIVFHLGGLVLTKVNLATHYWEIFKNNYK
jgi:hypothetical protein